MNAPASERATNLATNLAGTCGVCLHTQMIVRTAHGVLVLALHGYQRPGYGWQTRGCYSERREAWETSKAPAEEWLGILRNSHARNLSTLTFLKSGKLQSMSIEQQVQPRVRVPGPGFAWKMEQVKIMPGHPEWAGTLAGKISMYETRVSMLASDIKSFEKRLATWAPAELKDATTIPRWSRKEGAPPFQVNEIVARRGFGFGRAPSTSYEIWTGYGWERMRADEWYVMRDAGDAVKWVQGDRSVLLMPSGAPAPRRVNLTMTQGKLLRQVMRDGPDGKGRLLRGFLTCADRTLWQMIELGLIEFHAPDVCITDLGRLSARG